MFSSLDPDYPKEIQYGISTEPRVPKSFKGRGGVWACENCNKTKLLPKGSRKWTCEECQKVMWVTPISECPLEKARRFIVTKRQEFQDANQSEVQAESAVPASKAATASERLSPEPSPSPAPVPKKASRPTTAE